MSDINYCCDCGEPLTEARYEYPYKGTWLVSYWCNNCEGWKPDPLLPATRRNPKVGVYRE